MTAPRLFVAPPDLRLPWCFVAPILFWSCQSQPCAITQQQNLTLTRTLHRYLNQGNWLALEGQFADRVSYRLDSDTILRELPRSQFIARYRHWVQPGPKAVFSIAQMYGAGNYHVVVEGLATGLPPSRARPLCLIYTIEGGHFTRVRAY